MRPRLNARYLLRVTICLLAFISVGCSRSFSLPDHGKFGEVGDMNAKRSGHTATLLHDGTVLITGGRDGTSPLQSAEIFDPAKLEFIPTGSMTASRVKHSATLLPNGQVLIAGGFDNSGNAVATAERYNPNSKMFSTVGNMNTTRACQAAVLLPNGKVFLVGGGSETSSAELFDPASETFTQTDPMVAPRENCTATLLPNGKVLVTGRGRISDATYNRRSNAIAELYDPDTNTFSPAGMMIVDRQWHTATLLNDGRVMIVGGSGYKYQSGNEDSVAAESTAEFYDPSSGTFTRANDGLRAGEILHNAILLSNGSVFILGSDGFTDPGQIFDPGANQYTSIEIGNSPVDDVEYEFNMQDRSATVLNDKTILITGGDNELSYSKAAVIYNP